MVSPLREVRFVARAPVYVLIRGHRWPWHGLAEGAHPEAPLANGWPFRGIRPSRMSTPHGSMNGYTGALAWS